MNGIVSCSSITQLYSNNVRYVEVQKLWDFSASFLKLFIINAFIFRLYQC